MKERESKGNVLEVHKENGGGGGTSEGWMSGNSACVLQMLSLLFSSPTDQS